MFYHKTKKSIKLIDQKQTFENSLKTILTLSFLWFDKSKHSLRSNTYLLEFFHTRVQWNSRNSWVGIRDS